MGYLATGRRAPSTASPVTASLCWLRTCACTLQQAGHGPVGLAGGARWSTSHLSERNWSRDAPLLFASATTRRTSPLPSSAVFLIYAPRGQQQGSSQREGPGSPDAVAAT